MTRILSDTDSGDSSPIPMTKRILITGSAGLVGTAVRPLLEERGYEVVGFDIKGPEPGDTRDADQVARAVEGCSGIVHLGAVSRVVTAHHNPELCWETNVGGMHNVVNAARAQAEKPWLLFASSREVYGVLDTPEVDEDAPLKPMNVYARSKVEDENLVNQAREEYGMRTAIIRISSAYGRTTDHYDRVVPAFARAAAYGEALRIDGEDHTFDYTHLDDTALGITALVELLESDRPGADTVPPIHFTTGIGTTLRELADLAIRLSGTDATTVPGTPRDYDVGRFVGIPTRAHDILGWKAKISIEEGMRQLVHDFAQERAAKA